MKPEALLVVQHLLGSGHLRRAALLARALSDAGLRVTLASGGMPLRGLDVDGLNFVQLPAARVADASFRELLDRDGNAVTDDWREERRRALLACFDSVKPDLLIVETFPFGRRALRFELLPLLSRAQDAKKKPRIVCSVRDVLQQRKAQRTAESATWANRYFDAVWVHGDENFISLCDSFPVDDLRVDVVHTGYLYADNAHDAGSEGEDEIIVSAGGTDAAGKILYNAALAAADADNKNTWRILIGGNAAQWQQHTGRAHVENNRADFPQLLRNCAVSVSRAGCNTVLDILNARARAVLVPFEEHGETEQHQRATRLNQTGRALLLRERDLNPTTLAHAITAAASTPRPAKTKVNMNGTTTCAALAQEILQRW